MSDREDVADAGSNSPGEWITPEELAAELKISKTGVYRLIKNGEIPARRLGRVYRIRREWIDSLQPSDLTERQP